jgi:hypothetical protein
MYHAILLQFELPVSFFNLIYYLCAIQILYAHETGDKLSSQFAKYFCDIYS